MGSRTTELYQNSVGKKRKKLDARAFKALFKRQRIKEGFSDIHGKLEGPAKVSHVLNNSGRVTGSKPIGEGEDVRDECYKRLNGILRHLSIDKASEGDLQKSTGNLRTDSEILGKTLTVDFDYIDNVVAESPNPFSLADTRTDSRTAIDESTELQGIQVTVSKEGASTITASILSESLQKDSISSDDASNSMSGLSSHAAEVGTRRSEERFSLFSEQNNCQNFLPVELGRLCQILKLSVIFNFPSSPSCVQVIMLEASIDDSFLLYN
ncbi:hypothetical protein F511_24006 [Dorcoceras hygrometricum]|uniref:Uncharacterized protein n=1 Tax=Dorcoceras hygrometricum TaxID=472368 RepID=A0A2Z7B5G4_9LAMI|nr:hypothetical protein F511_24006 [Dorcoceras hygrometricum]